MSSNVPVVITACAGTVLAAATIVSLTAVAQEYVLGRERDAAIELHALSLKVSALEQGQAALAMKVSALEVGQTAIRREQAEMRQEMVTQRDFNNAITRLIAAIQEKRDAEESPQSD